MVKHECLQCGATYASAKGASDCARSHGRQTRRNLLNVRTLRAAIGAGYGDSLTMRTARASVEIVRHSSYKGRAALYTVQGDVTLEERNAARIPMTADKAHALALRCLAAYNKG